MKISFHGAARTVTGSKHLLTLKNDTKILFDCGLFQGLGKDTFSFNENWGFDPASVKYLLLSHAHIDHSGLIPRLAAQGFRGAVYATPATRDLLGVMLPDSGHLHGETLPANSLCEAINQKPGWRARVPAAGASEAL